MRRTTHLSSHDNPSVKDALRLRERRGRKKSGRFLVEGTREVLRALEAGWKPETLFVEEELTARNPVRERAEDVADVVAYVTRDVYGKLAMREDREGILAVFEIPDASLERLQLGSSPLVLGAVGIEKPGNVGALLRSADAFGVDAFVVEGGTDLWNPNTVRASLGCLFTVPVATAEAGSFVPWLKERGLIVVAAAVDGDVEPADVDFRGPVAIVLGSESVGLTGSALAAADHRVRIPMRGRTDSLNVSVSAGVLLYEADRQRSRGR
jgi:TrmH family RNA methyltransferase